VVQLDLRNITLVIHDWGALVGLNLARRFPERIRAVAFCEFPVKPLGTLEETAAHCRGVCKVSLAGAWSRTFDGAEPDRGECHSGRYGAKAQRGGDELLSSPVPELGIAPRDGPASARWSFAGDPIDTDWVIAKYSEWLKRSPIPKLLIHATQGLFVTPENCGLGGEQL